MNRGYPAPLDGVELQATNTCPRNYIIVDQTDSRSRIMFHPALAPKAGYQGFATGAAGPSFEPSHGRAHRAPSSTPSHKEDSDEIDALLSLTEEEVTEEEDDVTSTGRSSPEPCRGKKKKEKMKKMVKKLRGIIPGGDQMDAPAVLDEAVKYLKSLKVQVKKLHHSPN
ncbi:transcription factor bHLH144-like [Wolffia australiana]